MAGHREDHKEQRALTLEGLESYWRADFRLKIIPVQATSCCSCSGTAAFEAGLQGRASKSRLTHLLGCVSLPEDECLGLPLDFGQRQIMEPSTDVTQFKGFPTLSLLVRGEGSCAQWQNACFPHRRLLLGAAANTENAKLEELKNCLVKLQPLLFYAKNVAAPPPPP